MTETAHVFSENRNLRIIMSTAA